MDLYLLRHGIPVETRDWKGDDAHRPLSEDGVARMQRQAQALHRLGVELDVIVTSPLVRTVQTAEIVARELGKLSALIKDERLQPGMGLGQLQDILRDHASSGSLMLVGHDPDFTHAVCALAGGARLVMKKGGLARLELESTDSLDASLIWLAPPEMLL